MKILGLFPWQSAKNLPFLANLTAGASTKVSDLIHRADQALGFSLNECFVPDLDYQSVKNEFVYPATLTASIICFDLFKDQKKLLLDVAAGYSLGELSALVAAEALIFEDAIRIAHRLGEWVDQVLSMSAIKVIRVSGKDKIELKESSDLIREGRVEIVGIIAPDEIILAGKETEVSELISLLEGVKIAEHLDLIPLHSSFMSDYASELAEELTAIRISAPKFPVISNVSARPLLRIEDIKLALIQQLTNPVLWFDAMRYAYDHFQISHAVQFGVNDYLLQINGMIDSSVSTVLIDSLESVESFVV